MVLVTREFRLCHKANQSAPKGRGVCKVTEPNFPVNAKGQESVGYATPNYLQIGCIVTVVKKICCQNTSMRTLQLIMN